MFCVFLHTQCFTLPALGTMSSAPVFISFPPAEMEQAPHLDLSLEGLLRTANVHEEIIMAFRCQDVLTSAFFLTLDSTEEALRKTAKAFGINAEGPKETTSCSRHGNRVNPTRNKDESGCLGSCSRRTDFHASRGLRASPPRFPAKVWKHP